MGNVDILELKKDLIIFKGIFRGTSSDCDKLKKNILEANPDGKFIRVSFDMTHNQYFNRRKELFKGVARITNNDAVSFFKTVQSGKKVNIHSVDISDIKLLDFTKQDKINWQI